MRSLATSVTYPVQNFHDWLLTNWRKHEVNYNLNCSVLRCISASFQERKKTHLGNTSNQFRICVYFCHAICFTSIFLTARPAASPKRRCSAERRFDWRRHWIIRLAACSGSSDGKGSSLRRFLHFLIIFLPLVLLSLHPEPFCSSSLLAPGQFVCIFPPCSRLLPNPLFVIFFISP